MSAVFAWSEKAKSPPLLTGFPFPLTMRGGFRPRVSKPLTENGNSWLACQPSFDSHNGGD